MQILALVGESDIVRIKQGQSETFTVQALSGQTFTGRVEQVRLQSTTADNVVNYTVIVTVLNPEGKLLPGMTARVDFLVISAANVLKVSNAALRYRPSSGGRDPPDTNQRGVFFGYYPARKAAALHPIEALRYE